MSGALFPLSNLPGWLAILTKIDPATYAVDALRNAMLGISSYSFALDIGVLVAFTIGFGLFGGYSFRRMKAVVRINRLFLKLLFLKLKFLKHGKIC